MQPTSSTIDFSSRTNEQLQQSIASINRTKFEQNYNACVAEIQKRQQEGRWIVVDAKAEATKTQKIHGLTRALALTQCLGGLYGIILFAIQYGPAVFAGEFSLIAIAVILLLSSLFVFVSWAGWRYWKDRRDWKNLWIIMIYLQIPSFSIGGYGFGFFSGFRIPIGLNEGNFGITAELGSNAFFLWNNLSAPFHFTINLSALALLALLNLSTKKGIEHGTR